MYDLSCNLSELTDRVEAVVRRSGDIILEHWRHPSHVRHKGRIDLVTETDEAVEVFLVQELQQLVPQAGILAEEGDAFGNARRGGRTQTQGVGDTLPLVSRRNGRGRRGY